MVFSDTVTLSVTEKEAGSLLLLTFAAPNAINSTWLNHPLHQPTPRFDSVSGDAAGQGAFSIWQNGKNASKVIENSLFKKRLMHLRPLMV
jgi:hypothetical protein